MKKGKPLEKYLEKFYEVTAKTSEITRNLSLAGIAIIWIFKNPEGSDKLFNSVLVVSLKWIVISLMLDLFQYIYLSLTIKIFHKSNEHKLLTGKISAEQSKNLLYPTFLDNLSLVFFTGKIVAMIIGYLYLYWYIVSKI